MQLATPPSNTRRRYAEDEKPIGPRVKKGLAWNLESTMWAICRMHQPADLVRSDRSGWFNLTRRVDAAMEQRGFTSRDTHGMIQKFYKTYDDHTLPAEVVICLADGLGITGYLRDVFVTYGMLLRGRADTRELFYKHLISMGTIPPIERVVEAYRKCMAGEMTMEDVTASILPSARYNSSALS